MRTKRQLDDPRALRDQAAGAVIFAFGASGPEPRPLAGPVLVALLGALGMSEPTARATILRMRRGGWLNATRRGPVVEYALADPARRMSSSVLAPVVGPRPLWDGIFHGLLFSIPESERAYRDALRRAAVQAGFGVLRPGLLIVADASRWSRIEGLLAAVYRSQAAELRRVADRLRPEPPTDADAVRAMWEAMVPVSATAIEDPMLPAELLPADWPAPEVRAAIEAAGAILGPAVQAYIARLGHATT